MKEKFAQLAIQYEDELYANVIPFWEKFSIDNEAGGYFTCLDRYGKIYDTDKFVWLQGRQAWLFSMLYNRVEKKERWIEIARHGIEFLTKHGRDSEGNWYFALDRKGRPLLQPFSIFSDCFASMAFSQYGLAAGDSAAREIARKTYRNILARKDNPKGKYSKVVPGTRPLKSLGLPMILANLVLELEWMLDKSDLESTIDMRQIHDEPH